MSKQSKWSRSRVAEVVRRYSPDEALNSKAYQGFYVTHKGEVPSVTRILDLFGSWEAFRLSVWGGEPMTWTQAHCIQVLRAELPNPVNTLEYPDLVKRNKNLPPIRVLYDYFDSWADLTQDVWGYPSEWTRERVAEALLRAFKVAPTVRALNTQALKDPSIPTAHYCVKAFGSYRHMKEVVFENRRFNETRGATRRVFDEAALVKLMRQCFETEPNSFSRYNEKTKGMEWMPTANTYVNHFGSWEKAMMACYPDRTLEKTPGRWTAESVLPFLVLAQDELGHPLDGTSYRQWALGCEGAPSLSSIIRHWGKFSEAMSAAGIGRGRTHTLWTKVSIDEALRRFMNANPTSAWTFSAYATQTRQDNTYPAPNSIYYHYRSFQAAFDSVMPNKEIKRNPRQERKTKAACEQSLKAAYAAIGDPLTRARYQAWRTTNPSAPSRMAIVSHFGSWKEAIQVIGAHAKRVPTYQAAYQDMLLSLKTSTKPLTLQAVLHQLVE